MYVHPAKEQTPSATHAAVDDEFTELNEQESCSVRKAVKVWVNDLRGENPDMSEDKIWDATIEMVKREWAKRFNEINPEIPISNLSFELEKIKQRWVAKKIRVNPGAEVTALERLKWDDEWDNLMFMDFICRDRGKS